MCVLVQKQQKPREGKSERNALIVYRWWKEVAQEGHLCWDGVGTERRGKEGGKGMSMSQDFPLKSFYLETLPGGRLGWRSLGE